MLNDQPPEAFDDTTGAALDLHGDIWHTLQGEGPFAGMPCVFIRLAGCNLQCPHCDTEYTKLRHRIPVTNIVGRVLEITAEFQNTSLIVITGGEPTRQNIDQLVAHLIQFDFHVQIESNGVLAPSKVFMEWVKREYVSYVVSPKTRRICPETVNATAFKYVLSADSIREEDGLPIQALGHPAKPYIARPPEGYEGIIYINPMDAADPVANRANLIACRDMALKHGHTMGIQMHKLVGVD